MKCDFDKITKDYTEAERTLIAMEREKSQLDKAEEVLNLKLKNLGIADFNEIDSHILLFEKQLEDIETNILDTHGQLEIILEELENER